MTLLPEVCHGLAIHTIPKGQAKSLDLRFAPFPPGPGLPSGEPALVPLQDSVERYGRIEFRIDLDRQYARPFDPSEVDLRLIVETPSGRRLVVPAFYFQPCQRRSIDRSGNGRDWIYPAGESQWLVRFAPAETGLYHVSAQLTDGRGTVASNRVSFESTESDNRGFLTVRPETPRGCLPFPTAPRSSPSARTWPSSGRPNP